MKSIYKNGTFFKWTVRSAADKSGINYASISRYQKGWLTHGFCRMLKGNMTFVSPKHFVKKAYYYIDIEYDNIKDIPNEIRKHIIVKEIGKREGLCAKLNTLNYRQVRGKSKKQLIKLWGFYETGAGLGVDQKRVIHTGQAAFDLKARCSITRWAGILQVSRMTAWNLLRSMEKAGQIKIGGGQYIAVDITPAMLKHIELKGAFIMGSTVLVRAMLEYSI
jgi:DNA-binding transcriptional regulator YhcF (GntR family)